MVYYPQSVRRAISARSVWRFGDRCHQYDVVDWKYSYVADDLYLFIYLYISLDIENTKLHWLWRAICG